VLHCCNGHSQLTAIGTGHIDNVDG
jgi:hypothetical protein